MKFSRLHIKIFFAFLITLVAAEVLAFGVYRIGFGRDRFKRFSGVALGHALLLREAVELRAKRAAAQSSGAHSTANPALPLAAFVRELSQAYGGRVWLISRERTVADSGSGPAPEFPRRRPHHYGDFNIAWDRKGRLHVELAVWGFGLERARLRFRTDGEQDGAGEFIPILVGLALAFVVLSVPMSRLITRRLHRLRDSALGFASGTLSERAPEDGMDEIGELGRTFNIMASQIERMIAAQKELSAHVSHELRSPLARMRLAEEMLRTELGATPGDPARRLDSIRSEIDLVDRLVGRILRFAALESSPDHRGTVDAGALLNATLEEFSGLFSQAGLATTVSLDGVTVPVVPFMPVQGSADLLQTAFRAALENCVRYGISVAPVSVAVNETEAGWIVRFRNATDHAPQDEEKIFEPFQRGSTETDGHGLGLALLRRALILCGGSSRALAEKQSFVLELTLKAAPG